MYLINIYNESKLLILILIIYQSYLLCK
jgi:hypothetical protein